VHEWRRRSAEPCVLVQEPGGDDVARGEAGGGEEVLALQVVCEGVVRVGPGRDTLEGVAAEAELLREGAGAGGSAPASGVSDDRLAYRGRRVGGGPPDAAAGEDVVRADVQVVAGRVGVPAPVMPEVDPEVGLVRRLVLREARVAVDAEQGAAARPGVGAEVGADLLEPRRERVDEGERRLEQLLLVAVLVGREPFPVVVRPQGR
jgi:hypothetical protein